MADEPEIEGGVQPDDEEAQAEIDAALKAEGVLEGSATEVEEFIPEPETLPPTGTDLDVYRRMELEDERAVMEELQGRALDVMLYSFPQDGKQTLGFSWTGIAEGVGTLNRRGHTRIRISPEHPPIFVECMVAGQPGVRCTVYAEDLAHGSGNWGVAENPMQITKRNGEKIPDPFAYRKALSKAQRNAFEPLIPLELREYLKAQYSGAGKVKVIPGAHDSQAERPAALTDERAKEQQAKARAVYDEIKEIDRLAMPPGQFNAIIMAAQHDHERMEDAISHLEGFRDGEEEIRALRDRYRSVAEEKVYDRELAKMAGLAQQKRKAKLVELIEKEEG